MSKHKNLPIPQKEFKPQTSGIFKQLDFIGVLMEDEDLTDEARATAEAVHYNLLQIRKAQKRRSISVSTNQFIT